MSSLALAAAWLASVAPLALEAWRWGELGFQAQSRLGWVLLPWLALAGLPRAPSAGRSPFAFHGVLLAVPVLATAALQDLEYGIAGVPRTAAVGTALLLLLCWAGRCARGSARQTAYGIAWLVLVPGAVMLHVALTWGAGPGRESAPWAVTVLASASPLAWGFERMRGGGGLVLAPFVSTLLLVAIAWGPRESRRS